MKICFITPYSPKEVSGVGKFVFEFSKALHKKRIDSIIITRKVKSDNDLNQNIIEIEHPKYKFLGGIIFTIKILIVIFRKRKEIDIVNLQRPFILPQAIMAISSKILGLPVVSTNHGGYPSYKNINRLKLTKSIEKITFLFSDAVVYVDQRGRALRKYSVGTIIENGIDTDHFQFNEDERQKTRHSLDIDSNDFVIVFVGRLSYDKGIYELLNALFEIKAKNIANIKALLVGPLPKKEELKLRKQIEKLKLSKGIIMTGMKDDVHPYYCVADLFVLPSYIEGLPLALLEAMACRVPVVASDVGGIPFVIENYKDGVLVKPRDTKDLKEKIEWCLKNPDKLKMIKENAIKKVKEKYSLKRMVEEYIKIFGGLKDTSTT